MTTEPSSAPIEASPLEGGPNVSVILSWLNRAVAGIAVLVVGCLLAVEYPFESTANRKCGLDWMLWACGSERTFESTMNELMEASRWDFDEKYGDQFKPAFGPLDEPLELTPFEPAQFDPGFDR